MRACEAACWPLWYGGRWVVVEPITQYAHRYWYGRRSGDFHVMPTPLLIHTELAAHAGTIATFAKRDQRQSRRRENDRRSAHV